VPKAAAFGELRNDELEKNCVLSGGDDYELVFAAAPDFRGKIESLASELRIPLTRIGAIVKGKAALSVLDAAGRPMAWRPGYDHFAPAT
jgi:thiamine-monophosphate kinase